jgi:sugar phosphate isomerase/epimerase
MKTISFQLYSARNYQPFSKVLAMLGTLGYKQVEAYGGAYEDAPGLKAAMDANGLTMPTAHFGIADLESDKAKCLGIARLLGVKTIVVPYLMPDDRPKDAAGWSAFGTRLQAIALDYAKEGYPVAWHNHDFEFFAVEGQIPQALIFDAAPKLLWEIDIAWVVRGGADPIAWIKRYGERITSVHLKDIAPAGEAADEDGWADVGHGTITWPPVIAALKATPASTFIVEHDNPNDIERFARRSLATALSL